MFTCIETCICLNMYGELETEVGVGVGGDVGVDVDIDVPVTAVCLLPHMCTLVHTHTYIHEHVHTPTHSIGSVGSEISMTEAHKLKLLVFGDRGAHSFNENW